MWSAQISSGSLLYAATCLCRSASSTLLLLTASDWDLRLYNDVACLAVMRTEVPKWLAAYKGLPKDAERSDFFRCSCAYAVLAG